MSGEATVDEKSSRFQPRMIVSGGQTGVDRGALDAAIQLGYDHGGWCPKGRLAEDGSVPSRYALQENNSRDYAVRTEQNVVDSDATLIFYLRKLSGGTLLTFRLAKQHEKPYMLVRLDKPWDCQAVKTWMHRIRPERLNVAGPRESSNPGVQELSRLATLRVLG